MVKMYASICYWTVATAILSSMCGSAISAVDTAVAGKEEYIEPIVHRFTNVLPREVCQKIIELGEALGFPQEEESIDDNEKINNSSQQIDVIEEDGTMNHPEIYELFEPYLPRIADLTRSTRNKELDRILFPNERPNRLPKLHWVFFRKYAPGTPRNSLSPHTDVNMNSVNIALNDDYTGGGLFYIKPPKSINLNRYPNEENGYYLKGGDAVPDLDDRQLKYDYENLKSLRHENTTDVVFPNLETGDALIHNYTVWHAVAPIETGTRYSLILFFDMHNPCLHDDDDDDDDDDLLDDDIEEDEDGQIYATMRNEIRECDQTTGKIFLIEDDVDIVLLNPDGEPMKIATRNLHPGHGEVERIVQDGQVYWALRSLPYGEEPPPLTDREVLASIEIRAGQEDYAFESMFTTQEDCDAQNSAGTSEL